ncbi:MAG: hypothetical protein ACRDGS_01725 [Chloroflexota bacterium]
MVYTHPLLRLHYAVDGKDGVDAFPYDERNLREALRALDEAKRK